MSFRTDSNPQERVKNANNTVEYAAYESKMSKIQKASTVWRDGAGPPLVYDSYVSLEKKKIGAAPTHNTNHNSAQ